MPDTEGKLCTGKGKFMETESQIKVTTREEGGTGVTV